MLYNQYNIEYATKPTATQNIISVAKLRNGNDNHDLIWSEKLAWTSDLESIVSVSYTHLDVYKRQSYYLPDIDLFYYVL